MTILLGMAHGAAAADSPGAGESANKDILEILSMGGFMMYPLALLSLIAVVLIVLYFFTIRRNSVVSDKFMNAAEALIRKRDYLGLVAHCNRQNQSVARITEKTLDFMTKNTGTTFKEVREVAQAEGSRQAGILTHRISYLNDVGTIAPMAGLLGTVIGMIRAFMEIASGNYEGVHANKLAEGVYQALVTTASGLVIGITAVIFYSIFRGRVQKYIAELEAAATHLMALLSSQYNRRGGVAPQPVYAGEMHRDGYDQPDQYDPQYSQGGGQGPSRQYDDAGHRASPMPVPRPSNDSPEIHGM
ncbi:MAG: MotA/TolQ/ExbB proton channel family protein [Verrucomicrobiae bacterium]|nr:MotA/TolQ/ExbB proton channel family protein [Verrucomicrobiae bacterium]NNJ42173.1 MotA/TolQ/ExbB proton channel family protein [Akkermansiaceae bacterium]